MTRLSLFLVMLVCGGCDTFRALDSVSSPSPTTPDVAFDASDGRDAARDLALADEGSRDEGQRDIPAPDLGSPDVSVDMGPDLSGPKSCPDTAVRTPIWATPLAISVTDAPFANNTQVEPGVSLAASAIGSEPIRFIAAYRQTEGAELLARVVNIQSSVDHSTTAIGSLNSLPISDVAVARGPKPDSFVYQVLFEDAGCVTSGFQAVSAELIFDPQIAVAGDLDLHAAPCGQFRPRGGIMGPSGQNPNMRIVSANPGEYLAFDWLDEVPFATLGGDPSNGHVSTSTRDLVATANTGGWSLWRPALAEATSLTVAGSTGDLEIAHLFDGCYVGVVPSSSGVVTLPIVCETACAGSSATTNAATGSVQRAAVAAMPLGGFVVVAAVGAPDSQHLEATFYDDGFVPVPVAADRPTVLTQPGGTYDDFDVAATMDSGSNLSVAVVYSHQSAGVGAESVGRVLIDIDVRAAP